MDSFGFAGQRRLLITGVSGFLGWHLARAARSAWRVEGTYYRHAPRLPEVSLYPVDLTDTDAVEPWLETLAPDAVIHTAALSQPNRCEQEPALSYAVNVAATVTLARFCARRQIPFVFTSTDQVFDGQAAPYSEADVPSPINCYGSHKAEAERLIQTVHPIAAICRLPLLYGPASPLAESFLQGFLRCMAAGQPLHLFTDEFRSPAYVEDVATGLLLALDRGTGILHLGGPERISRYDFGLRMAAVFGYDKALLVPSRRADVPMPAARPADLTSCGQRALALGYCPRGVVAGLTAVKEWSGERA